MDNYLQNRGVRSGASALTLKVERFAGFPPCRVRVLPPTAIKITSRTPHQLRLSVSAAPTRLVVGQRFAVAASVWMRNASARDFELEVTLPSSVRLIQPEHSTTHGTTPWSDDLVFEPRTSGVFEIALQAGDGVNRQSSVLRIRVLPSPRLSWVPRPLTELWVQMLLVLLAGTVLLVIRRLPVATRKRAGE